jgi:hypothetical protein
MESPTETARPPRRTPASHVHLQRAVAFGDGPRGCTHWYLHLLSPRSGCKKRAQGEANPWGTGHLTPASPHRGRQSPIAAAARHGGLMDRFAGRPGVPSAAADSTPGFILTADLPSAEEDVRDLCRHQWGAPPATFARAVCAVQGKKESVSSGPAQRESRFSLLHTTWKVIAGKKGMKENKGA